MAKTATKTKPKPNAKAATAPMMTWAADKVVRRKISELIPHARNARTHSEDQIEQIAASMREFGWTIPVLCDEGGGVIAGHGRILAAPRNGWDEAPCVTAVGWTEQQKRAYVIADNKLTLNSEWDDATLRTEFEALSDSGFDLSLTGFDQEEIDELFGEISAPDQFKDLDPATLATEHQCPSCGYEWSGKSK